MTMQPLCSFIPSASGFGVDFGCQNTEPHEVFGGALGQNHPFLIGQPGNTFPDAQCMAGLPTFTPKTTLSCR